MKLLLLILMFCSCRIERDIQIQRVLVKVIKIEPVYRQGVQMNQITWEDAEGVRYTEFYHGAYCCVGTVGVYFKQR